MIWHGILELDELDELWPLTDDSIERMLHTSDAADGRWGQSESLDPDNVGDIADEGAGHRG